MTNAAPIHQAHKEEYMPPNLLQPLLDFLIPPGFKAVPALAFQVAGSAIIGWAFSLTALTYALLTIQLVAGASSVVTNGLRSDKLRGVGIQMCHMWLVLGGIEAISRAHLIPFDPYPYLVGVFLSVEMLVILKNASASGLDTPGIDSFIAFFQTRIQAPPPTAMQINDRLAIASKEFENRVGAPLPPLVIEVKTTEPIKDSK